jgi:hypothetical protein
MKRISRNLAPMHEKGLSHPFDHRGGQRNQKIGVEHRLPILGLKKGNGISRAFDILNHSGASGLGTPNMGRMKILDMRENHAIRLKGIQGRQDLAMRKLGKTKMTWDFKALKFQNPKGALEFLFTLFLTLRATAKTTREDPHL